ncbi:S41 family peptidase [Massilia consociata]|uniref:S41 family peptidase n=1 Tax=Massilia consociata TaxID=760117 RepID=A0ABV6FA82_9BURK
MTIDRRRSMVRDAQGSAKRWAKRTAALATAAACAMAGAAPPPADPIPAAQARQIAARIVDLVETRGLPPREPQAYAQAKRAVTAIVENDGEAVDRRTLYARVKVMLDTLDADGHSFIMTPVVRKYQNKRPMAGMEAPRFALVETAAGKVLHWTPPQTVDGATEARAAYLKGFIDDASALPGFEETCALVVDLSAQHGGNAWPPLIAMRPLFSTTNSGAFVDRDGKRTRFVHPPSLEDMQRQLTGGTANPLSRFAGLPLAVVVDRFTSSAGEMLLVALLGEGGRTRSFGRTSQGMTTANRTYTLDDGSYFMLSEKRYAVGNAAPIRGGIVPQQAATADEPRSAIVLRAAQWAASESPLCKAQRTSTAALK